MLWKYYIFLNENISEKSGIVFCFCQIPLMAGLKEKICIPKSASAFNLLYMKYMKEVQPNPDM